MGRGERWDGWVGKRRSGRQRECCAGGLRTMECRWRCTRIGRMSTCGRLQRRSLLRGEVPVTQFGRMCERLEIRIIAASSPQAKGRVERNHGTHQDRLGKKNRPQKKQTQEGGNTFLEKRTPPEH